MPNPNVVGKLPEFDGTPLSIEGSEDKQAIADEAVESEKETPSELPTEEKPADEELETPISDDTKEANIPEATDPEVEKLKKSVQGLRQELINKHKELAELKGAKREVASQEALVIQQKVDDLKDLNPQDVELIDRIIRSKGMMTEEQFNKRTYEQVKNQELNAFLNKYPEYKPENDPGDLNWSALQKEFSLYRMPNDPHQLQTILERSHSAIVRTPSDLNVSVKKRQMQTAGVGGGGSQRSSTQQSHRRFTAEQRAHYERGGWSDADIAELEQDLPE